MVLYVGDADDDEDSETVTPEKVRRNVAVDGPIVESAVDSCIPCRFPLQGTQSL